MSFIYKELSDDSEVKLYVETHKKILSLSDQNAYPPSFFSIIIRKEFPLGVVVGCYHNDKLIGMVTAVKGKEGNSIYVVFAGVLPEYQGKRVAVVLIEEFRKIAFKKGYFAMYGVINPLQSDIAKIHSHIGSCFFDFISASSQNEYFDGKILFKNILDPSFKTENNSKLHLYLLEKYPIIDSLNIDLDDFLIQLPITHKEDHPQYDRIKNMNVLRLLHHYLHVQKLVILNCFSIKNKGVRRTYYYLSKTNNPEFMLEGISFNKTIVSNI